MADKHPFENNPVDGIRCEEWEAWLAESLDGELAEEKRAAFESHGATCPTCSELLANAAQGREWMQFLHEEPHVPPALVGKILDQTTGLRGTGTLAGAVPATAGPAVWHLTMRRSFQETRLLMTLAMAFFSITLTLNLIGFRPGNVKLQDLSFSSLENAAVRGFYSTKKNVVFTYENTYDKLRFLYELNSQVRELKQRALSQKAKKGSNGGAKLAEPPVLTGSQQAVNEKVQPGAETAQADEGKVVVNGPQQENKERPRAERSRA